MTIAPLAPEELNNIQTDSAMPPKRPNITRLRSSSGPTILTTFLSTSECPCALGSSEERTVAVTAVFFIDPSSLSLFFLIRSYNAARRALVGVSGIFLDELGVVIEVVGVLIVVGVFGRDISIRFPASGVTRPSVVGVVRPFVFGVSNSFEADFNLAAAFPKLGVLIPLLRPLLGVTTPPLLPELGVTGLGPWGVTGLSPETGNGILNPSESSTGTIGVACAEAGVRDLDGV